VGGAKIAAIICRL